MKITLQPEPHLYKPGPQDAFFAIPPTDPEGIERARQQLQGRSFPRDQLAKILATYNTLEGSETARLFAPNATYVVTGQQLGFMGGPAYTIWKAISCLLLAKAAGAIPLFWVASEDHDIGEIDHTYQVDPAGNLTRYKLSFPPDQMVEDLQLIPDHQPVVDAFWRDLGPIPLSKPAAQGRFVDAMVQLLRELFAGTGLLFIEPYLLRPLATDFFQTEMREAQTLHSCLVNTTKRLQAAGCATPLPFQEPTNLFFKNDEGKRVKIRLPFDASKLLHPERLSTNAAARCVLQSLLIPTLAYVAGPNELAYHAQLGDYYRAHGSQMPWIVPRLSGTILFPEVMANTPQQQHFLRTLTHPREQPQDRVLNWLPFQARSSVNLIQELLATLDWQATGHYTIEL